MGSVPSPLVPLNAFIKSLLYVLSHRSYLCSS